MRFRLYQARVPMKVLLGVVLLLQVTACGNSSIAGTSSSPAPTIPVSRSATPVPTPSEESTSTPASLVSNNPKDAFDVSGLFHIQPTFTINCGINNLQMPPVLRTDRLTYDRAEIQQMAAYFDSFPGSSAIPASLQKVAGGFVGRIPNWNIESTPLGCSAELEITNIGQSTIGITRIGMKLVADPQPNTYQYRLIDVCSLPLANKPSLCPPGRGASSAPYNYHYRFGAESGGAVLQDQTAEPFTLNPGDTADVMFYFAAETTSASFIYSVVPELTLNTSSAQGTILDVSQLTSTIAFVNPSQQLSCYQLHGDTFVPLDEGPVLSVDTQLPEDNPNVACM